jgi:hypothetical protein
LKLPRGIALLEGEKGTSRRQRNRNLQTLPGSIAPPIRKEFQPNTTVSLYRSGPFFRPIRRKAYEL